MQKKELDSMKKSQDCRENKKRNSVEHTNDENRAFQEMFLAAKKMLEGKKPEEIAENLGISYDEKQQKFLVSSLGEDYEISYPDFHCEPHMNWWKFLCILHAMNLADGFPVTQKVMTMGQLPGGMIRGTRFDRDSARDLADILQGKTEEEMWEVFGRLGGIKSKSRADLCVIFPFLKAFPFTMNLWLEDEEFPLTAKLFVDESAPHYLTVEDVVSAGEFLIRRIREEIEREGTIKENRTL